MKNTILSTAIFTQTNGLNYAIRLYFEDVEPTLTRAQRHIRKIDPARYGNIKVIALLVGHPDFDYIEGFVLRDNNPITKQAKRQPAIK